MTHRILVVEDEPDIAWFVRLALAAAGFVVIVATDLAAARLALAAPTRPDLVVLDLVLSDGDGLTLCRDMKRAGLATPVLIMTARPDQREAALAAGAAGFLPKPFELDELEREVRRLLDEVTGRQA